MNGNSNGFAPQSQGQFSQNHINPAMLAALQSQQQNPQFQKAYNNSAPFNAQMFQGNGGLNPQQLMNNGRMPQQQSLNPAMLLQSHASNQAGLGGGMNGINPASLGMSGSSGLGNMGMNMGGGGGMANTMGFTPEQLAQLQAMTPEQIKRVIHAQQPQVQQQLQQQHQLQVQQQAFQQQQQRQFSGGAQLQNQQNQQMAAQLMRNHQQQQFGGGTPQLQNQQHQTAGLQAVLAQQQAQQNIGNFYDRPSSSASATHSQGSQQFNPQQSPHAQQFPLQQTSTPFQMMPPPPPRPPSSRPGTSNSHPSHHSGQPLQVAGPQSPSLGGGAPMQRPPSRPRTSSGVSPFAPQGQPQPMMKPPTPIQPAPPQAQVHTPTHMNSPFQPQGGAGPFGSVPATPTPGSPGRKRKLTGPDGMQMNASPQYGMSGGGLGGLGMSMSNGAVNAGGGGLMAASSGNLANLPLSASNSAAYMGGAGGGLMGPPHVVPARAGSLGLPHSADSPNPLLAAVQAPLLAQHTPALNAAFLPGTAIPGLPDVRQRQPSLDAAAFADLPGPSTRGHTAMLTSPAVQAKLPTPMQTPVRPTASVTQAAPAPSTSYPALPAFPGSASLNAKTTRVTIVDPGDVRDLTEEEIANVKVWSERDKAYDVVYRGMKDRVNDELRDLRASAGTMWWEAGDGRKLRTKFGVTYPGQRARENRKRGRREGFKLPPKVRSEDANRPEVLVPIRLEFDVEHHKMRDTFVWNLNDTVITPDVFAQSIVDDYALAPSYLSVISKAIQDQLSDYKAHMAAGEDEESVTHGRLAPEEEQWWEGWRKRNEADALAAAKKDRPSRKRRKVNKGSEVKPAPYGADGEDKGMVADVEMDDTDALEEMRILVKLDIVVGSVKLEDQFEWDIDNPGASPEQFAEVYAQDLGLGGEFKTGIAHSIREQVQTYQKSLFLVGHPSDGTMVQDDDLRMSFLPSLTSAARSMDQITSFTPTLAYLSDSELERTDKEREKEMNRRRKRNTRGRRGIALPDREPIKTARTPAIGFPDVDPATLALAAAAAAPTSRRAAAAAASLTIANMVASENGTALITPTMPMAVPTAPTPVVPKEKKTKGLFKPPSYPSSVLRPRAHVHAPTMSTAADASTLPPPLENDPPAPTPVTAPNSTITKVISAKRAKELEREAKEKEFADGQHANMINGVWHCSNCGCPEDIAIGRRKGPLGDKSQCGTCGKYWHRHRRPMPVVYNSDPEFHLNLRAEAERAKTYAKKKGGAAALRAANAAAAEQEPPTPAFVEPETPTRSKAAAWSETPRRTPSRGRAHAEDDRQVSPVSSGSSSASEPIVSQKMKVNGVNHAKAEALQNDAASTKSPSFAAASAAVPAGDGLMSPSQHTEELPPEWLREHRAAAQREYPNDRFEVLSRLGPTGEQEWRLKCLDCPGKLYKPGDRNLSNFEVHLKNRNHRARVNDRLRREAASHGDSS